MALRKLLIANRGEIAIRIARAAAELDIATVAVYAEDDGDSLHRYRADMAVALRGHGAPAYLDMQQLMTVAQVTGCDAVHPGYGFLSESAAFAQRCTDAALIFVGPEPHTLSLLGDKVQARACAESAGLPLLPGTRQATSLDQARQFFTLLGPGQAMIVKAVAGGGGRGMRVVTQAGDIESAYTRCQSEATAAFGLGDVYVEQFLPRARHIEVQIIGDGSGDVSHVWERECSLQRRHQKLVEIAPSPTLAAGLRERLLAAAVLLGERLRYRSLGTVEFLVDATQTGADTPFFFMEANPRLQVEHTVTEEVTGIDLVMAQLQIAGGATLAELDLLQANIPVPRGYAIQQRINLETFHGNGDITPTGGTLAALDLPSGPGVRVDTYGYTGYATNPRYDSLLAKLIVHVPAPSYAQAVTRARQALGEFRIQGVPTNIGFLQNLLAMPAFLSNDIDTTFVERHAQELAVPPATLPRHAAMTSTGQVPPATASLLAPPGTVAVPAPTRGIVVSIDVAPGAEVRAGQALAVLEAMKMEHLVLAPVSGIVRALAVGVRDNVAEGQALLFLEALDAGHDASTMDAAPDLAAIRPDLAMVLERHRLLQDAARPEAVAKRRQSRQRTARENLADLCDPDSFIEYGGLVVAAQRQRKSVDELITLSPADGMVSGIAAVNGALFGPEQARCAVLAYDFTVFAGTQGQNNHHKLDRLVQLAEQWRIPLVLFAEGGGGRPNDTDIPWVGGLHLQSFRAMARLSALVPTIGIASGRCFAGNAALLGCCDIIIATEDANIGMGGPAMIEGGGLGSYAPEEIGPIAVQAANGVVDVRVADEAAAVVVAKQYLSYFQGPLADWSCADQRLLRQLIPENRLRVYDIRRVIEALADIGSVLELRREFGVGMVTALIRIEGRPLGLIANNPKHLGGAIDADAADKAARFMQLCDAFDLPMVSLCDTPGFMVGPEVEKTAQVRHVSRLFVTAASLTVPYFTVVLRKAYGLGAMGMAGGGLHAPFFSVAWPTGEFGGMGLEGAVRLAFRKELAAIAEPAAREALFQQMVKLAYERGQALNTAALLEIDDVIDPQATRHWLSRGLKSVPAIPARAGKKRPCIDSW